MSAKETDLDNTFWPTVQDLHDITDKKVSMVAYSWGNNVLYHQMMRQNQTMKDDLIERVYMIGPPLLGSVMAMNAILSLNSIFEMGFLDIGFDYEVSNEFFPRGKSYYELIPVDVTSNFAKAEWFKEMLKRRDAENDGNVY